MTTITSSVDTERFTLTFVAEFAAPAERVWQVWEDPRQLERWWGPPTYPATFEQHDFVVGGRSAYYMTGPDGDRPHGWWQITAIEAPHRLEFDDGFADEHGEPTHDIDPMHAVITLEPIGDRTRMTSTFRCTSLAVLEQMIEMGMTEGSIQAQGQIAEILAS